MSACYEEVAIPDLLFCLDFAINVNIQGFRLHSRFASQLHFSSLDKTLLNLQES